MSKRIMFVLVAVAMLAFTGQAEARRAWRSGGCANGQCGMPVTQMTQATEAAPAPQATVEATPTEEAEVAEAAQQPTTRFASRRFGWLRRR